MFDFYFLLQSKVMDKNKSQTFILSVNDFGQKICTSQSEPNKKWVKVMLFL